MFAYRNFLILIIAVFSSLSIIGCRVGGDDPFISFRSRDNRIKANWKLTKMKNWYEISTVNAATGQPSSIAISQEFDGYDMHIKTIENGVTVSDSTFGYTYMMKIKDGGELSYNYTTIIQGLGIKNLGTDTWYWLNTDKNKSRIDVGSALQSPLSSGISFFALAPNLPFNLVASDFAVDGLRKTNLQLSTDKTTSQIISAGAFQTIKVSARLEFDEK